MKVDATDTQITEIRGAVERSHLVRMFAFLTKDDALREYHHLGLPGTPPAQELPVSFRVKFRSRAADGPFTHHFETLDGVDSIRSRTTILRGQRSRSCSQPSDLEVFLIVGATKDQQAAVGAALAANPAIRSQHFVTNTEALRIFKCIFGPEPQISHGITSDALPTSFLIKVVPGTDVAALKDQLTMLPSVDSVAVTDTRRTGRESTL